MDKKPAIFALLCSTALFTGAHAAQAEPVVCKGAEQVNCTESAGCRWVSSYKRSDGREISGYCRKLPAKKKKDVSSAGEVKDAQPQKS